MKRFILHINGARFWGKEIRQIEAFCRRYLKIRIVHSDDYQIQILIDKLREIGCEGEEVRIDYCAMQGERKLLSCFPNVVKLEIAELSQNDESFEPLEPSLFRKLKHLKVGPVGSHHYNLFESQLSMLEALNLTTLDVSCGRKSLNYVAKMLENQRSLDTLHLRVVYDSVFENFDLNRQPDLQIRRIFVYGGKDVSLLALNITLQFGGKVEYLYFSTKVSEEGVRQILQHFGTIKALTISELPSSESFYDPALVNSQLTELVIMEVKNSTTLLGAFKIYPNLKKLSISMEKSRSNSRDTIVVPHETVNRLRVKLGRLERFTVALSQGHFIGFMKHFANITDLYIEQVDKHIDYSSLIDSCKNLTFFSKQDAHPYGYHFYRFMLDPENVFKTFPKLATLQLDQTYSKVDLLPTIRDFGKNLKSLKLKGETKDFRYNYYQETRRRLGLEKLKISVFSAEIEFSILNKGVFKCE